MRRLIQNEIEEQLSILILQGQDQLSKNVIVDLKKDKIAVFFDIPGTKKTSSELKTKQKVHKVQKVEV